ncbi:GNAT family N-acetyltransferase [Allobranchiibius sp. CTAmp26]|uniref:GNAT family N-acetyltransferase n=1 Tax=Allobranchiibius sp. CTAmp26 TaxID=2815214 RepID=UPI001AA183D8|nr:GNAT family N-acetyltransferase [Allobranchiibius sp. CTAmp26]MBO1754636.1 GNAT family N-acetyltransferase [Allobranchiibius sp. CTAmp26]
MTITLQTPDVVDLGDAVRALGEWQYDGPTVPLHPGDLGWHWTSGAQATAAAMRTWARDGRLVAVGLLDGPEVLRLTIAPDAQHDEELARRMAADITQVERGVLPAGKVAVEARDAAVLRGFLADEGWVAGEAWTPLSRDLRDPVGESGVRIELIGPGQASEQTVVHRSAFESQRFTDERWHAMAEGPAYADARSLVAYDDHGHAVAEVTVWSAGPGKPGLLEPMGVHAQHRGRGYGRAICIAAAAALRQMGSSSATVCTRSANTGGIATYEAAGYRRLADVADLSRPQ